jgi:hypothetical protein
LKKAEVRLARIRNTVALDEIAVSENLLGEVRSNARLAVAGEPFALGFDANGNLL